MNSEKILEELKEKATFVKWHDGKREEYYAIVAKSFSVKTKHALCIDLKDLENIL